MSRQNIEAARRAIDAFNRSGVDALMDEYAEDAVLIMPPELPNPGRYEGRDAIRRTYEDFDSEFADLVIEVDELVDLGDRVLAMVNWRGTGRTSGAEVSVAAAFTYAFEEGKIKACEYFYDRAAALEAVRVRE
jgi:ketosteroid isomerase-like protein